MSWLEILGLVIVFWFTNNLCYRLGVKSGIKHSIKELKNVITSKVDQEHIEKLNTELKRDSHDLAIEAFRENISTEGKLLN
tara:strand:+ start:502 stop:744 length:243 start_codon:yes stop_codon:yes gene_type:complete